MLNFLFFIAFIAIFIFGMTLLRTGLYNLSSESLKIHLARLTDSPIKGLILGMLITAAIHSSSAVMVITIGLISARILSFQQTIGIMLGANIGTTFTAELITFNMDQFTAPLAVLGVILMSFKRTQIRSAGLILFGISAVFTAMRGFEFLAGPLTAVSFVENTLAALNKNLFFSVVFGTLMTAIIQSSTAMTGITMGFLSGGILNIDTGIAIMLGSNIGTCITAYLASLGAGREARLCAYAHIWINILGVMLFLPLVHPFAGFVQLLANETDIQLAHASVLFNVFSSLIVLPFARQYGNLILRIYGDKKV